MHEAVTTQPATSAEQDHTVGAVYQVGYMYNGMLLRPARVVVRQWNG
jgi:molecular chaperone GrpE